MNSSFTGESIGGMAAAGAAKALTAASSSQHPNASTILPCDRTFCNPEAVAPEARGALGLGMPHASWMPAWSTDVARDSLAARRPKIVAQDSADEIMHDYSSLKIWTGVRGGVDQRPAEENRMDHVPADGIPDCGFGQR